jgi:hypothetical protein
VIYEVSRFGVYRLNSGDLAPGWQSHYIGANSPEEAKVKALPILDEHKGFQATDPAEVREARCHRHPRYKAKGMPTGTCGVCHAIWLATQEFAADSEFAASSRTD